ncbi:MAG: TetR/AcrR family transcriptional regulator [Clostridia bacterium]|nr:TetR/AcrR family transcriptional regulator [Clostridia bacterium]
MDRRQRKTREAIFGAFTALLAEKDFEHITVGEIIDRADVGRATFYSHFETKDFLLKELCAELFCHISDAVEENCDHKHIFDCVAPDSAFLHLFMHLQKNDNGILELLSSRNNGLFLRYFKDNLMRFAENQLPHFISEKNKSLPKSYLVNHIASTFVETVHWWLTGGRKESPETMTGYFLAVL